jgi:hypothetical protein
MSADFEIAMPLTRPRAADDPPPEQPTMIPAIPLLIGGVPKPPTDAEGAAAETVLTFPETAIGTVVLTKKGEFADIRPASGEVRVPSGWTVQLNLPDAYSDGTALAALPPDGVQVLIGAGLGDDAIGAIADYRMITYLRLGDKITRTGLAALGRLTSLTMLSIASAEVDDAAVEELTGLTELLSIHLAPCAVTDEGIRTLTRLPKLTSISMTSANLTDAAAQALAESPTLQYLTLECGALTNDTIRTLATSGTLETLSLTGSFDDSGLLELRHGFPALQTVRIDGPDVTDEGVLAAFAAGITAQLNGQWFSPKAAERLRQRRANA